MAHSQTVAFTYRKRIFSQIMSMTTVRNRPYCTMVHNDLLDIRDLGASRNAAQAHNAP
jgi:hypothetical protein